MLSCQRDCVADTWPIDNNTNKVVAPKIPKKLRRPMMLYMGLIIPGLLGDWLQVKACCLLGVCINRLQKPLARGA